MNKYYIKYWESENDRNEVFSNYFFKTFDSFDEALKESRILFNKNNLSSLEIVDYTDKLYFSKDNISEDFLILKVKTLF